jgi:hypothetical protein
LDIFGGLQPSKMCEGFKKMGKNGFGQLRNTLPRGLTISVVAKQLTKEELKPTFPKQIYAPLHTENVTVPLLQWVSGLQ